MPGKVAQVVWNLKETTRELLKSDPYLIKPDGYLPTSNYHETCFFHWETI